MHKKKGSNFTITAFLFPYFTSSTLDITATRNS